MKKITKISFLLAICGIAHNVYADEIFKNSEEYKVSKEDTVWAISSHFLKKPWMFEEKFEKGSNISIYPGDILFVEKNGSESYLLKKTDGSEGYSESSDTQKGIPIPVIDTARFNKISSNTIISNNQLQDSGLIVRNSEGNFMSQQGDEVFVEKSNIAPGQVFDIYNQYKEYKDKDKFLGYSINVVGQGIVTAVSSQDNGIMRITRADGAIKSNNKIVLKSGNRESIAYPSVSSKEIQAKIISSNDKLYLNKNDTFLINKGSHDGIKNGNIFAIKNKDEYINSSDINSKNQSSIENSVLGLAMAYDTYDNITYCVILESYDLIRKDTLLVSP